MAALLPLTLLAALVQATDFTPTAPVYGDVFYAGSNCTIEWIPDTTGDWSNFNVDFMTGSDIEMFFMATVVSGLNGSDPSNTSYTWTCPTMVPPAPIYILHFSPAGDWGSGFFTSRFTIADSNGTWVPAEYQYQPPGQPIPWGVGMIQYDNTTNTTFPYDYLTPLLPSQTASGFATVQLPAATSASPNNIEVERFSEVNEGQVDDVEHSEPLPRAVSAERELTSGARRRMHWESVGLAVIACIAVVQFMMFTWA